MGETNSSKAVAARSTTAEPQRPLHIHMPTWDGETYRRGKRLPEVTKQDPDKDLGLKLGPDLEVNVDRTRQIEAGTPYIMRVCKHRRLPTGMQMILEKPYLSAIAIYGLEHARLAKGQVQRTRKRLYQTAKALTGLGQDGSNGPLPPRRRAGGPCGGRPPTDHPAGVKLLPQYNLWLNGADPTPNRLSIGNRLGWRVQQVDSESGLSVEEELERSSGFGG